MRPGESPSDSAVDRGPETIKDALVPMHLKSTLTVVLLAAPLVMPGRGATLSEEISAFSRRFQAAQPPGCQQAIWKLDWEDHLSTALARAKRERRPVLFIHVTNITGPSNFGTGHC
jgi:hypothetical protein